MQPLELNIVREMEILGDIVSKEAATSQSILHRQKCAEACYYQNAATLTKRAAIVERLRAWGIAPAAIAIYGAETWVLNQHSLIRIHQWEMKRLRIMFRMGKRPFED